MKGSILDSKYGNAKNGLCGGFVCADLDYFNEGWQIPQTTTTPIGEGVPLSDYLVQRLWDTFSCDSVSLMLKPMDPAYPDSDENMLTVKSAWPGELGECHQVLAYGYEARGYQVRVRICDPNSPEDEAVYLAFEDGDVSQRIVVDHNINVLDSDGSHRLPVYCFTRMDYAARRPTVSTRERLAGVRRVAGLRDRHLPLQRLQPGPDRRRPPDPLWDPDPVMVEAGAQFSTKDPALSGLTTDLATRTSAT